MREPKKVRTRSELIKSCRELRKWNEHYRQQIAELEYRLEIGRILLAEHKLQREYAERDLKMVRAELEKRTPDGLKAVALVSSRGEELQLTRADTIGVEITHFDGTKEQKL